MYQSAWNLTGDHPRGKPFFFRCGKSTALRHFVTVEGAADLDCRNQESLKNCPKEFNKCLNVAAEVDLYSSNEYPSYTNAFSL